MTDYTRITNFTIKDSLTVGDPEKTVSGQEIQAELDLIALAVNSKPDTATVTNLITTTSPVEIQVACSDLSTALTTGSSKAYFRAPRAFTLASVRASLLTASSSGLPTINVRKNNTTIFTTKVTIDANEKTSVTAATPHILSTTAIADDDLIEIDIDVAGTGAKGLIVTFLGA